jgi:hypothetical protein
MPVSFQTVGLCLVSTWVLHDSIAFFAECELFIWLVTTVRQQAGSILATRGCRNARLAPSRPAVHLVAELTLKSL